MSYQLTMGESLIAVDTKDRYKHTKDNKILCTIHTVPVIAFKLHFIIQTACTHYIRDVIRSGIADSNELTDCIGQGQGL